MSTPSYGSNQWWKSSQLLSKVCWQIIILYLSIAVSEKPKKKHLIYLQEVTEDDSDHNLDHNHVEDVQEAEQVDFVAVEPNIEEDFDIGVH